MWHITTEERVCMSVYSLRFCKLNKSNYLRKIPYIHTRTSLCVAYRFSLPVRYTNSNSENILTTGYFSLAHNKSIQVQCSHQHVMNSCIQVHASEKSIHQMCWVICTTCFSPLSWFAARTSGERHRCCFHRSSGPELAVWFHRPLTPPTPKSDTNFKCKHFQTCFLLKR